MRTKIHFADLIRVIHALKPDTEAIPSIALLLGLSPPIETLMPSAEEDNPVALETKPAQPSLPDPISPAPGNADLSETIAVILKVEAVEEGISTGFSGLDLPEPLQEQSEEQEISPKFHPLLSPKWTRAIFTRMLSINASNGNPDITRLIRELSQKKPLKQIPAQSSPTLRQGVQLLIDEGPGMIPYRRDQIFLLQQLRSIVGNDRVEAWTFTGTPLKHAMAFNEFLSSGYTLPNPGMPILMLTDLGISSPPYQTDITSIEEWSTFVDKVCQAGYPLMALIPYAPVRWPDPLKDKLRMMEWDYKTSVLTILPT